MTTHSNDLKAALQSAGWRIAENHVRDAMNEADWYAWRPGRTSARECCCNDKPPAVTVNPYEWALEQGIAKEQARALLPEGLTPSRLYMTGSIRSWMHYIEVRTDKATQKEHRLIAESVHDLLKAQLPAVFV